MRQFYLRWFVAQEGGSTFDPSSLVQWGPLGVMLFMVAIGLFWPKPAVDTIKERAERAEAQRDKLLQVYEDRIMPTMSNAVDTLKDIAPTLTDVKAVQTEVKQALTETRVVLEQIRRER